MKLTAVFAGFLVASASIATAQPKQQEKGGRVSYSDKHERAIKPRVVDGDVVELASPTPASHGKEFITVGQETGRVSQLRIDAHHGRTIIRRVRIEFVDGKSQVVDVDKAIDARKPCAAINIMNGPRAIDTVIVTTDTPSNGSYTVHGIVPALSGIAAR